MSWTKIVLTSDRVETIAGWSRRARVGGQEYTVSVRRGKSVRIPYKPRGKNRGWHWHGAVYRVGGDGGRVWEGRVPGSIGCRGLLFEAGVVNDDEALSFSSPRQGRGEPR